MNPQRPLTGSFVWWIDVGETKATAESISVLYSDLKEHLKRLPYQRQRLLRGIKQIATDAEVYAAFRNHMHLLIVSDGEQNDGLVTYSWQLDSALCETLLDHVVKDCYIITA